MRNVAFAALIILGVAILAAPALAAPCAPGTLQDYIDLVGGCTIGAVSFSNFVELSPPAEATAIPPIEITVTPLGEPSGPGFEFGLNVVADAGEFLDAFFGFQVTDGVGGASLAMDGATATGGANVTVIENLCRGGVFSGVDCSADPGASSTMIVFAIDGDSDPTEDVVFPPVSFLDVLADIGVDGGIVDGGRAELATATLRFETGAPTSVPEPPAIVMFGLAVIAVWLSGPARQRRAHA